MAQREQDPRIQSLYDAGVNVYSFSKLNTIDQCLYSAYRTYVKKDRGLDSVYTSLGSSIHDTLQTIIEGTGTTADLLPAMQNTLQSLSLLDMDFPHDSKGGTSIRDNWISSMTHFCKTFTPPRGTFTAEQLLILNVPNNRALIGYADLIQHFPDGSVRVLDWKTSSRFKPEDLQHHGRQLLVYSMALKQQGYAVHDPCWIMLKYAEVTYQDTTGTKTKSTRTYSRICERCKIAGTILLPVTKKLKESGRSQQEIDVILQTFLGSNSLSDLPDEIASQFTIKPYVLTYQDTPEREQECLSYIDKTASLFESLNPETQSDWPSMEVGPKNAFFCNNLCGHRKTCMAVSEYNQQYLNRTKSYDEMF